MVEQQQQRRHTNTHTLERSVCTLLWGGGNAAVAFQSCTTSGGVPPPSVERARPTSRNNSVKSRPFRHHLEATRHLWRIRDPSAPICASFRANPTLTLKFCPLLFPEQSTFARGKAIKTRSQTRGRPTSRDSPMQQKNTSRKEEEEEEEEETSEEKANRNDMRRI